MVLSTCADQGVSLTTPPPKARSGQGTELGRASRPAERAHLDAAAAQLLRGRGAQADALRPGRQEVRERRAAQRAPLHIRVLRPRRACGARRRLHSQHRTTQACPAAGQLGASTGARTVDQPGGQAPERKLDGGLRAPRPQCTPCVCRQQAGARSPSQAGRTTIAAGGSNG